MGAVLKTSASLKGPLRGHARWTSRRQLRQLAIRAVRQPDFRPVFQDMVLESPYGSDFESSIEQAHSDAQRWPHLHHIVFYDPFIGRHKYPYWFDTHSFRDEDLDITDPDSKLRSVLRLGRIPVYTVPRTTSRTPRTTRRWP